MNDRWRWKEEELLTMYKSAISLNSNTFFSLILYNQFIFFKYQTKSLFSSLLFFLPTIRKNRLFFSDQPIFSSPLVSHKRFIYFVLSSESPPSLESPWGNVLPVSFLFKEEIIYWNKEKNNKSYAIMITCYIESNQLYIF